MNQSIFDSLDTYLSIPFISRTACKFGITISFQISSIHPNVVYSISMAILALGEARSCNLFNQDCFRRCDFSSHHTHTHTHTHTPAQGMEKKNQTTYLVRVNMMMVLHYTSLLSGISSHFQLWKSVCLCICSKVLSD